ncbi:MAG: kynureninase, partial [Pseudomonadota bacterium]
MTLDDIRALDRADPLAPYRDQFELADGLIYLDGNSLGPMAKTIPAEMAKAVEEEWGHGLISSWNDAGWWELPVSLGAKLAPLLGAAPGQVVVSDSTSVNIYKTLQAGLALRPERSVMVSEAASFPTDLYITEGAMQGRETLSRRLVGEAGASLADVLDEDVAVVLLSHVDYRSG